MRNDIRLFIGDKEIEFSADPKILLNYKETELHNPTVVRNSFTKQITVEGTNRNNDIFGHIWNLERIQEGMYFNPIKKTDFQLFVNDELFQKGYVKLDKVTRTNNTTQYTITLYGGLGSFFYNLTFDEDNSGSNKKTLASLSYATNGVEPDLDFTINRDSVQSAWNELEQSATTQDRWKVINFCPALNGIPNDFSASKVLINFNGINGDGGGGFQPGITEGGVTYYPTINGGLSNKGYSLGEMDEDLQEWQTRDIRSYNQRPCINMKRIIDACGLPENNGGYQLVLDPHFFYSGNPYYNNSWVTLPMLKDLDGVGGGETYNISGATISNPTVQYGASMFEVGFNSPAASLNNVVMSVSLRFNPTDTTTAANLYPHHTYSSPGTPQDGSRYVREAEWNSGVIMQMFALGTNGTVVGQSKAYLLSGSKYYEPKTMTPMWDGFYDPAFYNGDIGTQPDFEYVEGYFKRINGDYVFVNPQGQQTVIQFSFSAPADFATLVLKVKTPWGEVWKRDYATLTYRSANSSNRSCYTSKAYNTTGDHTYEQAISQDQINGTYSFVVTSFEGIATDYEGLFSGTRISKDRLLSGQHTPADYLLSYAKLFGLYFYYDSTEEASDPVTYPSGVVHLMDRDTFYTEEYVDLSGKIDWNKKVEITPAMAASKWYRFDVEHVDSQLETGYKEQYGQSYGSQMVNTSYNFDSNTTDLYNGNVFKAGIMALEKDKYYKSSPNGLPVYQYNGFVYNLYNRNSTDEEFETYEVQYPVTTTMHMLSVNPDYEFYNSFPLLEFHGEDNSASDGSGVLVFYKGTYRPTADYWLTDDVNEMITLNDAEPCWIMTKSAYDGAGNEIAKKISTFPYFTRDLNPNGMYGNIYHSWNFGHPQAIYMPDTYTIDGDSIYDKCWKNYIRDLYDVNTRKLTCYVRAEMDEHPWPYWFRRFYWYENSLWVLNEIKDLNPASFDTTKMEFIKVQDVDNYKLNKIEYRGTDTIMIDEATIGCDGGTVHGTINLQTAGEWSVSYIYGLDGYGNYSFITNNMVPSSGSGLTTNFIITVPANSGDTEIRWTVVVFPRGLGRTFSDSFIQETCSTGSSLSITPGEYSTNSPSGQTTFTVASNQVTGLTATSSESWLTVSLNGSALTATWTRNTSTSDRSAMITVAGTGTEGPISDTATVVQSGLGQLNASPSTIYIEYNGTVNGDITIGTSDIWSSSINDN